LIEVDRKENMDEKRLEKIFLSVFGSAYDAQVQNLEYQAIPEWDSIGHMSLVAALEAEFEISLEVDDVIDLSSFDVAKVILSRYVSEN
jgi:acyl carrier protein